MDQAKEAFLQFIADALRFDEQTDAEQTATGRWVDRTTYHIVSKRPQFEELCEALGIKIRMGESIREVLLKEIEPL